MRNKNRFMALGLVVLLSASALVGCGDSKAEGSVSDTASGEREVLRVQMIGAFKQDDYTDPITGESNQGMHVIETAFEAEHTDIDLEFIFMGWDDYQKKTQSMMMAGEADVYQAPGIAALAEQGLLEPLQTYIDEDNYDLTQYIDGQVEGWMAAGPEDEGLEIYGLPFIGDTRFIMYDKQIFDEWGVEYLSVEPSLEEIVEKSAQMTGTNPVTGEENYGIFYVGKDAADTVMNFNEYLGGTWGEGIRSSELVTDFASSTMIEAANTLNDLTNYAPAGVMAGQGGELFGTEDNNIAIHLRCAPANVSNVDALGLSDRYGVSRLFINEEEGMGGMFAGSPFVIAESSTNKDAAWEFMKFTATETFTQYFWENQRNEGLPVTKEIYEFEGIQGVENVESMIDTLQYLWTPRYVYRSGQGRSILTTAVESVILSDADEEEVLGAAQTEVEEWVAIQ